MVKFHHFFTVNLSVFKSISIKSPAASFFTSFIIVSGPGTHSRLKYLFKLSKFISFEVFPVLNIAFNSEANKNSLFFHV